MFRNPFSSNWPATATYPEVVNWKESLLWVVIGAGCFNLAYEWVSLPVMGLWIIGYALALVRLTNQSSVRRAFYFGLATAYLSYAPQLLFMWNIFGPAAIVLWLVLAFWVGLFAAIICGARRRWGGGVAFWLIPVVWTGVEYFRSELYYLKFSWMNIGYALPVFGGANAFVSLGMYGEGFLLFALVAFAWMRPFKRKPLVEAVVVLLCLIGTCFVFSIFAARFYGPPIPPVIITGIQWEFANDYVGARSLDQTLRLHPETDIFVLSEYTLEGPVPDKLKNWCREHRRYLVVGGKDPLANDQYYNTAYVVGTNGDIVFQQAKSVPIQFFKDGLPAPNQKVWHSPWGKIGICICYDLSYTRVTDELIRQGAQLLIVPTMDVATWGRHQHELHSRVAPVRSAEYGVPIFRLASSGISQAVENGHVVAHTSFPGEGEVLSAKLQLPESCARPIDRWLAPLCVGLTGIVMARLLWLTWMEKRRKADDINCPA
jgi:apolipoprotein N-acyltransferase